MNIEDKTQNIFEPKKGPNKLIAEEIKNDDNSIANLHESKLKELKIFNGEPILLRGRRRHETLCIAVRDNTIAPDKIAVNKCTRNNLRIKLGDLVTVRPV